MIRNFCATAGITRAISLHSMPRATSRLRGASDVINRGGATIYSAEIEAVLLDRPAVCETAVLGYPAGDLGEEIAGFVVLREEVDVDRARLIGHCRDRLGPDKVPRRFILRDSLPKATSGKPDLAAWLRTHDE
jgi:acyl-CoA synthetase (AMP-forming)/AMP-acid ligase II